METLDRPDDKSDDISKFSHLSLEKQFTHRTFCEHVKGIKSLEQAQEALQELHLVYLGQCQMVVKMARDEFSR